MDGYPRTYIFLQLYLKRYIKVRYIYLDEDIVFVQMALIEKIVGIAIGMYVVAAIMPSALVSLAGANLSGVDPAVVTILQVLLPILATIGIALVFFRD